MSPLVRACIAAAVLAALGAAIPHDRAPVLVHGGDRAPPTASGFLRPCPPRTLLDNQVCVPAPDPISRGLETSAPHADWRVHDRIPRRPERPKDHRLYRLPVRADAIQPSPFSEEPGSAEALLLGSELGAKVTLERLEGQVGDAAVLYAGELVGRSVVTEHRVREGQREQTYLVILGNLQGVAVQAGTRLKPGAELGSAGNSASGHAVGVHLETRKVRQGVDARQLASHDFLARSTTVLCDPRNVFTLQNRP